MPVRYANRDAGLRFAALSLFVSAAAVVYEAAAQNATAVAAWASETAPPRHGGEARASVPLPAPGAGPADAVREDRSNARKRPTPNGWKARRASTSCTNAGAAYERLKGGGAAPCLRGSPTSASKRS